MKATLILTAYGLLRTATASPVIGNGHAVLVARAKYHVYPGSHSSDGFPPPDPTNGRDGAYFPSESTIPTYYVGATQTGVEPFVAATATPIPKLNEAYPLVTPTSADKKSSFNPMQWWGNYSPWRSLATKTFGICHGPEVPKGYSLEQVHLVNRHGARYPTSSGNDFAEDIHHAARHGKFKAKGELSFLNTWTYGLGQNTLTPFGRLELFEQGVAFRQKYGKLLNNFTSSEAIPVFRTTSYSRMYDSAVNFMEGMFGYNWADQIYLLVTNEGGKNYLAPGCDATVGSNANIGQWPNIYLANAQKRFNKLIEGYTLNISDVYNMQTLCAYETVALGYSEFCDLFTPEEWEGYSYSVALGFYYENSFGSPSAAAVGIGYAQNLLARLTHQHTPVYNTSTDPGIDGSSVTNPLNQSLYIDFSHDNVISSYLVALNLTAPNSDGPLPLTYMPKSRTFIVEQIAPFATQLSAQILADKHGHHIRFTLNDAVMPLTGMKGCEWNEYGLCPLPRFIAALRRRLTEVNFEEVCG